MTDRGNTYLFVYGTLLRSTAHPAGQFLRQATRFVAEATAQGKLYDLGRYPGMIRSDAPDDIVFGELYELLSPQTLLTMLDEYEGCGPNDPKPYLFVREKLPVKSNDGELTQAWVYLYNHDLKAAGHIANGRYNG